MIGFASFLFPFLGAMAFAYHVTGWDPRAAQIAGIALSTTSVAVVYAVMVETRLNETDLGKLILATCFVTDLGTVLALGVLFASFNAWMVAFVGITALTLWQLPRVMRWILAEWGGKVSEPELKFLFLQPRQRRGAARDSLGEDLAREPAGELVPVGAEVTRGRQTTDRSR